MTTLLRCDNRWHTRVAVLPEPLAKSGCGEEDVERVLTHLHELIARRHREHQETGNLASRGNERPRGAPAPAAPRSPTAISRAGGRTRECASTRRPRPPCCR